MIKSNFWIGILIIWLSHLFLDLMLGVWPVYKSFITIDLVVAGMIASVGMLIGEGLQLYFGLLSDRGFHQRLMTLGISLTITIPFLSYVESNWMLFLCVLCAFVGSGAFHPSASSLVAGASREHKSVFISLFACGGMVGAAMSQYLFIKIHSALEGGTWILAIPIVILGFCCAFFRFHKVETSSNKVKIGEIWEMIKPRRKELLLLYLTQLCLQIVVLSFSFLLPDLLKVKGYESWFCLGGGYFYFIIGAALTSIPIGYCVDKVGYKNVLTVIILMSMILLSIFLKLESLSLFPMIILLMLSGGFMGVIVPVVVSGGTSLVPEQARGVVSALYMGGCSCLAGFGPTIASLMASSFEEGAPVIALQLLSSLLMIALSLLYFLPPHRSSISELKAIKVTLSS
jgi:FSR family fosmidomycin resistance protein-like MFS transporter